MTFYQTIELLCNEKGVTPEIMAMRTGISLHTVRSWKYRNHIPKWETLQKLSDYFHVPRDFFLPDTNRN